MPKNRIIRYALILLVFLTSISFAVTPEIKEYKVIKGDCLWNISKKELNDPFLWSKVWKENSEITNPDLIYPDQMIKIPLNLIQQEKLKEEATLKPADESQEPVIVADQSSKGMEEEPTLKLADESRKPFIDAEQRYKRIKGIVLQNGKVIEGQILFMNAEIVSIRTKDEKILSYSFIKEVESFIDE